MEKTNYSKIYADLTKGLSDKTKEIFSRRFGIGGKKQETLESIGDSMSITRERVRQIEAVGFSFVKKNNEEILDKLFKEFTAYFKNKGGFKKEDLALSDLSQNSGQPYILFLLNLGDNFSRVYEKKDFYSFWSIMPDAEKKIGNVLSSFNSELEKIGAPLSKKEIISRFTAKYNFTPAVLNSYLEVSKNIRENSEGRIGLINWPEIRPRGVRDKSFLVFRKEKKPIHFKKLAELIDASNYNLPNKKTLPQTVHNELIKDPNFVLVGRGIYALKEWGYNPGTVREVIVNTLKEAKQPMTKKELMNKVLSQRLVAENTILINLNDKKYFSKDEKGKYTLSPFVKGEGCILRKTQTA